ncbi:MAG: hypothetical protein OJJ54_08200 [Pseudonocardia sp.]|nr:hypothetical protein [Pseudonocardia sp.]
MTSTPSAPTGPQHAPEPPTERIATVPAQRSVADAAAAAGFAVPSPWSAAGAGPPTGDGLPTGGAEVPPGPPADPRVAATPGPRRVRRWPWAGLGLLVGLAAGVGIGAGGGAQASGTAAAARPATITVTAPAPAPVTVTVTAPAAAPQTVTVAAAPTTEAAPAGPLTTFSDGTYEVGTDVAPGKYKSPGPDGSGMDMCYWRIGNAAGSIDQNDIVQGPGLFTVKAGKVVELSGGCTWTKVG